jgi:signal peptidase I
MDRPPSHDEGSPVPGPETYHRARKPLSGIVAGATVAAGVAWACLRWRPSRVEIEGGSMAPALAPGDWALVVTPRRFRVGDVVVVEHPMRPGYEMVKRIRHGPGDDVEDRVLGDDEYWVEGDFGVASTDSRQFGAVGLDALKAKVVLIYWPKERRRLVR